MAVVTGASEGIGRAFAFELARHGHDLLLIARHAGPLEATAAEVVRATGRQVDTFAVDLTSPDATKQVMEELKARHCQVNILVNNAGVGLAGKFQKHEAVGLATLADLNVRALTLLTHAVLPGMLDRGRGGVINVASLGGHIPGPNQAAYYASKAYVISLTEALAWEARGRGVQITAVMPGPVNTQFHADMGAERSYYLKFMGVVSPERVARAGYRGYRLGLTLVYPRLIDRVLALCLRLSPHFIAVPIVSWLLRKRNGA
ncbi:MAG: SDR family oxidoreductase [Hyphomicrobiaceae bacterium]